MMKRILILVAVVLVACFEGEGYSVKMLNTGSRDIDDAQVSYGRFVDNMGVLIPNAEKVYLSVREPLPRTAVVEWRDADGARHQETVTVLFARFQGVLVFEIDGQNHVHVRTESPPPHITP